MVEYSLSIDNVFASLSDPIRRDILERVCEVELSVNEIALDYDISLAATSKHLKILYEANLIKKRRQGKYTLIRIHAEVLESAEEYLRQFTAPDNQQYKPVEK